MFNNSFVMEKIKLVFLGTGCSNPTVERNLTAIALRHQGQWMLFDCAEGTQRQMMKTGVSYMKTKYIFFSHFHADHFLGFPGLVATMSMHERDFPLHIFGPKGTKERIDRALSLGMMRKDFEIKITEVTRAGTIVKEPGFEIDAFPLKHEVPCLGFAFREKNKEGEFQRAKALKLLPEGPLWGKLQNGQTVKHKGKTIKPEQVMDYSKARTGRKISVVMDTLPSSSYFDYIMDSDVLVHEAAFADKFEKRAKETTHSTARQAAKVAVKTNAKKLVITHVSPRHKKNSELENEARQEFANVVVAKDLDEIEI
jgi:ribonuclease Z